MQSILCWAYLLDINLSSQFSMVMVAAGTWMLWSFSWTLKFLCSSWQVTQASGLNQMMLVLTKKFTLQLRKNVKRFDAQSKLPTLNTSIQTLWKDGEYFSRWKGMICKMLVSTKQHKHLLNWSLPIQSIFWKLEHCYQNIQLCTTKWCQSTLQAFPQLGYFQTMWQWLC